MKRVFSQHKNYHGETCCKVMSGKRQGNSSGLVCMIFANMTITLVRFLVQQGNASSADPMVISEHREIQ